MQLIEGQKGGSKKQHTPVEQPDNLLSTAWNGNTFSNKKIRGCSLVKLYGR